MNDFPNLDEYGYKIEEQLGCNREGGRITWKGKSLINQKTVVIKQFRFAVADSSWSGYKAYEQEIKILQQLNHSGIPKYLDGIETENGFCLIQQYIAATNLNNYRALTIAEVKKVTLKLLEILVYLQQQNPPILHRDIKPDNILLSDELRVYLIDFGFASLGSKDVMGSSVFKGTPGFIAPEQIVKPTLASDLYSLGMTIVCLLSNKNITEIRDLASTDNPYQLKLKSLFPELDRHFRSWLEKMTNAKTSKRFPNASIALDTFLSINSLDSPKTSILPKNDLQIDNLAKTKTIAATSAIVSLSSMSVWGITFVNRNTEFTAVNIAIAILAGIVIGITELSAIEIAKIDNSARVQGTVLGLGVPIFLVGASSIIWGISEAVDIAATIIIIEMLILSYFWWQIPFLKQKTHKLRFGFLFAAIFTGITLGLRLI
ncbi:MAG: serine/threonine protein kinase [Pleurocapsa sp.]